MEPQWDVKSFLQRREIEREEQRKFHLQMLKWMKENTPPQIGLDGELLKSCEKLIAKYQAPISDSSSTTIERVGDLLGEYGDGDGTLHTQQVFESIHSLPEEIYQKQPSSSTHVAGFSNLISVDGEEFISDGNAFQSPSSILVSYVDEGSGSESEKGIPPPLIPPSPVNLSTGSTLGFGGVVDSNGEDGTQVVVPLQQTVDIRVQRPMQLANSIGLSEPIIVHWASQLNQFYSIGPIGFNKEKNNLFSKSDEGRLTYPSPTLPFVAIPLFPSMASINRDQSLQSSIHTKWDDEYFTSDGEICLLEEFESSGPSLTLGSNQGEYVPLDIFWVVSSQDGINKLKLETDIDENAHVWVLGVDTRQLDTGLGMGWLYLLGEINHNWDKMWLGFTFKHQQIGFLNDVDDVLFDKLYGTRFFFYLDLKKGDDQNGMQDGSIESLAKCSKARIQVVFSDVQDHDGDFQPSIVQLAYAQEFMKAHHVKKNKELQLWLASGFGFNLIHTFESVINCIHHIWAANFFGNFLIVNKEGVAVYTLIYLWVYKGDQSYSQELDSEAITQEQKQLVLNFFIQIVKQMGAMVYTLVYVWVDLKDTNTSLMPLKHGLVATYRVLQDERIASCYIIIQQGKIDQQLLQWKDKPPDTSLEDKTLWKAGVMIGI